MTTSVPEPINRQAVITDELHGLRFDQAAAQLFPEFSRSKLQSWVKSGAMTLDGAPVRPRDKVVLGQSVVLQALSEPEVSWEGEDIPLNIIYEDEHVIVLNKPAGLVVHPAIGHRAGTLVNALLAHAPELDRLPRGGIVHRLDKDTSGIMFVARSTIAHQSLIAQLAERTVSREYSAVCMGALSGGGSIDAPIDRHPTARTKMAVVRSGKHAVTHYRLIKRFAHHSQLAVHLETGRTHQIRVHMAYRKHPLVGDPQYGGRARVPPGASERLIEGLRSFPRQALHARTLSFEHPESGDWVSFETPIPNDLAQLIQLLKDEDSGVEPRT